MKPSIRKDREKLIFKVSAAGLCMPPADERIIINKKSEGKTHKVCAFACVCEKERQTEKEKKQDKGDMKTHAYKTPAILWVIAVK